MQLNQFKNLLTETGVRVDAFNGRINKLLSVPAERSDISLTLLYLLERSIGSQGITCHERYNESFFRLFMNWPSEDKSFLVSRQIFAYTSVPTRRLNDDIPTLDHQTVRKPSTGQLFYGPISYKVNVTLPVDHKGHPEGHLFYPALSTIASNFLDICLDPKLFKIFRTIADNGLKYRNDLYSRNDRSLSELAESIHLIEEVYEVIEASYVFMMEGLNEYCFPIDSLHFEYKKTDKSVAQILDIFFEFNDVKGLAHSMNLGNLQQILTNAFSHVTEMVHKDIHYHYPNHDVSALLAKFIQNFKYFYNHACAMGKAVQQFLVNNGFEFEFQFETTSFELFSKRFLSLREFSHSTVDNDAPEVTTLFIKPTQDDGNFSICLPIFYAFKGNVKGKYDTRDQILSDLINKFRRFI